MKKYQTTEINIPVKEIGYLEGKFNMHNGLNDNHPVVLILPPHPKLGATMNNAIVSRMNEIFLKFNFNTLRINFRGIGKSQGVSQGDNTEIIDGLHALDWLIKKTEFNKVKSPNVWVAGYGFGSYIALQIAMRRPEVTGFIAVATSFNASQNQFNMLTPFPTGLIVHAKNDNTCRTENVKNFYQQLIVQNACNVELDIQDNDHYFKDELLFNESLSEFLSKYYVSNSMDD